MRALLLAAGLGTRLKPLTNYLPKCLIPIHGRPLLDFWLESLCNHGVSEIIVNTHYFSPLVVEYIQRSSWARYVKLVYEEKLLGTGGTILANSAFFRNEPFLVAHADNLTLFDFQAFEKRHRGHPSTAEITMMVFKTPDPKSCGIVGLDQDEMVTSFHEKVASPPGNLANAAVYILEPSLLEFLASLRKTEIDFSTEVIPQYMGRILTYRNVQYHRDIGTVASWADAHKDFLSTPASPANVDAWAETLTMVDAALPMIMARLLTETQP